MTIQVISNDAPEAKAPVAPVEPPKSAPAVESAEQNESTESDTEETEAKDESMDSEEDSEPKDEAKDKPKKKGGFQRRIDKLNARYTAAQQEADHWKSLALKSKDAGEAKMEPVESKPAATDGKPNPDSFDTHAEYVEALTDWKTEQKFKEREQKEEKSKLESQQEKTLKAHHDRETEFAKTVDDYADVMEDANYLKGASSTVAGIIVESEHGPALMYELAKNMEEFKRINSLPPIAAALELGVLKAKLASKASEEKQETKKITKAPKPIDPVGGAKAAVTKSLDDPNLTQAEYEAIRRKQLAARKSAW